MHSPWKYLLWVPGALMYAGALAGGFAIAVKLLASQAANPGECVALLGGLYPGRVVAGAAGLVMMASLLRGVRQSAALAAHAGATRGSFALRLTRMLGEGLLIGMVTLACFNPATVPKPVVLLDLSGDRWSNIVPRAEQYLAACRSVLQRHAATGVTFKFLDEAESRTGDDDRFESLLRQWIGSPSASPPTAQWSALFIEHRGRPIADVLKAYQEEAARLPFGQLVYVVSVEKPTAQRTKGLYPLSTARNNTCEWIALDGGIDTVEKPALRSLSFTQSPLRRPMLSITFDWPHTLRHAPGFKVKFFKEGVEQTARAVRIDGVRDRHELELGGVNTEAYSYQATQNHLAVVLRWGRFVGEFDEVVIDCEDAAWRGEVARHYVSQGKNISVLDPDGVAEVLPGLRSALAPGIEFAESGEEHDVVWERYPGRSASGGKPRILVHVGAPWPTGGDWGFLRSLDQELSPPRLYERGWAAYPAAEEVPGERDTVWFEIYFDDENLPARAVAWQDNVGSAHICIPGSTPPAVQLRGISYMLRAASYAVVNPQRTLTHKVNARYNSETETFVPLTAGSGAKPAALFIQVLEAVSGKMDETAFAIPPTSLRPYCLLVTMSLLALTFLSWVIPAIFTTPSR